MPSVVRLSALMMFDLFLLFDITPIYNVPNYALCLSVSEKYQKPEFVFVNDSDQSDV